jgi:chromate transporter
VGELCFIVPGLVLILALAALFLSARPPGWVLGAAAGAAVPAVAVHTAAGLIPASWRWAGTGTAARVRWIAYLVAGAVGAALIGPWLVLVLIGAGLTEIAVRAPASRRSAMPLFVAMPAVATTGGLLAVAWVAAKVGALSYGGGFVIIPLMQHDAVQTYGWMTDAQFLDAVVLGQITPGAVVQTVAVVGYAAAGLTGGLLAALVVFAPSFAFVLIGGPRLDRLRANERVQAFLTGAEAAAIGAIAGSTVALARALSHPWQGVVLALVVCWLLMLRRGVVTALIGAGSVGVLLTLTGWT